MIQKAEREFYNFTVGHFLKFLILLGEKVEEKQKMQSILDPNNPYLTTLNYSCLELQKSNGGDSKGIGKLRNKATTFIKMSKFESHY